MAETLEFDPVSEDATNTPLALTTANGYRLMEHSYPDPPVEPIWASNIDTEGARLAGLGRGNREITIKVEPFGDTAAAFRTAQNNLDKKLGKLQREGGTLKRTLPNGDVIVFDVLTVINAERQFGLTFDLANMTEDGFTLVCLPFGRGTAQTFTATSELSLPVHRFLAASVKGDVPALGKMTVTDLAAQSQFWTHWGIRQRHYSNSANNALFYEAEGRTVLGGAATAVGTAPVSGAGSNVVRQGTLTPNWQAMLSTQATGGGAHLEHIGIYELWARVFLPTTNNGSVSIRLDWAEGDFLKFTANPDITLVGTKSNQPFAGQWWLVNLGQVFLKKVAQGTQRWQGRIVAKSTAVNDDLDVDCFWLRPIEEGQGTARGLVLYEVPTAFSARDEFDQTAGSLGGKTAPVGGAWVTAGDLNDFSIDTTADTAQRTTAADVSGVGRYAVSGVAAFTAQVAQIDFKFGTDIGTTLQRQGPIARYTDTSNWLRATKEGRDVFRVLKNVAGTTTELAEFTRTGLFSATTWYTMRLLVDVAGRWFVWFFQQDSSPGNPYAAGQDAALATGGALASGKPGFYDEYSGPTACTRSYDNFQAFVPTSDFAVFASQSLEVRHDRVIREDSGGTIWQPVSDYNSDYLLIPPAGMEARTSEILVKASRNDPEWGPDTGIDDIEIDLEVTPRYLKVPQP